MKFDCNAINQDEDKGWNPHLGVTFLFMWFILLYF